MYAAKVERLKKTVAASNKNYFTILLSSVFLLTAGRQIYELVLPLLIYELTHSAMAMAHMRTAELLPNFFFAILIGVLVDRVNQKSWAIWMVGLQALLLVLLAGLFYTDVPVLMLYYTIGFLLMTFNYGFFNVQVSLTKRAVPASLLTSANAKISFTETLISIMGPVLSGLLFLLSDITYGLLITAILFTACLGLLKQLPEQEVNKEPSQSDFYQDLKEGWTAFRSSRALKEMTLFVLFMNCSVTVVQTSSIFFAKDVLKLSSSHLAWTLSAAGIGGLVGSILVSRLRDRWGLGRIYGLSLVLHGAACGILAFRPYLTTFVISIFLVGLALSLYGVTVYTLRHEQTPSHLIGRIAGITGMFFRAGMPIAMLLAGWVMTYWGTTAVFAGAALWDLAFFLIYLRSSMWSTP